jgi:hypothetical protein
MKQYAIFCMAVIMLLMSCTKNHLPSILTTNNLPSTFITLATDSGYTLQTPKGAIIKIDANSFDVPKNSNVKIEIKEAYSAKDILLAGLSTTSNGKLLSSGGMLYFNATVNGQNVNIIKPIHISVPTKNYDTSMQLFKGEIQKDSTIDWVDPKPLDSQVANVAVPDSPKADSPKADTAIEDNNVVAIDSASTSAPCGYDTIYSPIFIDTSMQLLPSNADTIAAVVPEQPMYQFSIDASGWYNIDCFINANLNAVTIVKLKAILSMQDSIAMQVYLCIPQRNLLADAFTNEGNNYTFYNDTSGSIPLILNDDAILFAIGTDKDKMYYGITQFKVQASQNISVNIKEGSRKTILEAIKNNNLDSVKIDIDKPEIIEKQIEIPVFDSIGENIRTDTVQRQMQMRIVPKNCGERILM